LVVPEEKVLIKRDELGMKYPILTPTSIAKNIHNVKYRSKNPNLFFMMKMYEIRLSYFFICEKT